ncbi:MAG: hypothetical protein KAY32_16865 [Candidatus Eisenbacteria sp.]|nr:hypothetical protein [Candidatus Eisenbacteria bacterium]
MADAKLSQAELDALWHHLHECPACAEIAIGFLHAAAWEIAPDAVSSEDLDRFRANFLAPVQKHVPKPGPVETLRSVILHLTRTVDAGMGAEPVLVGDGASDARSLQAELPSFASSDTSVLVRLRRDPATGRILAYVIADSPDLARWCSLIMEPGDREFVANEDGICVLENVTENDLRTSSLRVRSPVARFIPQDDCVTIDSEWAPQETLVLQSPAEISTDSPEDARVTATLSFTPSPSGQSSDVSVVLSDTALALLAATGRRTLVLVTSDGPIAAEIPHPAPASFSLRAVSLPFSLLEARLFGD